MKKCCLFAITVFLFCLAHPQDRPGPSIPNTAAGDPRIKGRRLLVFAKTAREKGDTAAAKKAAFEALAIFTKERTPDLADAEFEAARYYDYSDPVQNHQRVLLYRDAIPIFEKTGRRLQQAQALELLGDCLQYHNITVSDALPPLLDAFHLYMTLHETDLRNISALLACTYSRVGDHHSALLYGLMAIKQEEARPVPALSLVVSYNRVGLVYYNMGDYLHADTFLTRAIALSHHFRDTNAIKESVLNGVLIKIRLGQTDSALLAAEDLARHYPFTTLFDRVQLQQRFLRIYIATGDIHKASPIFLRFTDLDDSLPPAHYFRPYIDPALIEYALAIKDYPLARKYALRYRGFCIHSHCPSALYKSYYQLYLTDSAEGHLKSAMANYLQYVRLRDSLQSQTDTNQVLALQEVAQSPTPSVATTPAHQQNRTSWLLPIGAGFLVIGAGFLAYRYRTLRRNRQLEAEKEWLVNELHHRVKNNLQIVMSLLNTQSHYLDNEKAQAAIGQSRNRMYALSLIHQRLYQPDNLEQIDMTRYIPDLVHYLRDSFPGRQRIVFHLDIDPVPLDVAIAVPVGLILNEAISNSLQWAFPGDRPGAVHIMLRQQQGLILEIADDGIGLPQHHESLRQQSMGAQLMETLVQQLEGNITITGDNGTRVSIRFPHSL